MNLELVLKAVIAILFGLVGLTLITISDKVIPALIVALGLVWLYQSSGRSVTLRRPERKAPVA